MKINIKKLSRSIFILLSITLITCSNRYEMSFQEVKLNGSIEKLIDIYLYYNESLNTNKNLLTIEVVENNGLMIVIDNSLKSVDGYDDTVENTLLTYYRGYKIYVYDEKYRFCNKTGNRIKEYYKLRSDSIVPIMYNGNPWEVNIVKGKVESVHLYKNKINVTVTEIEAIDFSK